MLWQWLIVAILVAGAAAYVVRQSWRTWFGRKAAGCGGSCSCPGKDQSPAAATEGLISVDDLTARLRQRQ